jgi:hypothetical protein
MYTRRNLLRATPAAATAFTAFTSVAQAASPSPKIAAAMSAPVLRTGLFRDPVRIESVELLKNGKSYIVRVRSKDGAIGYADAHSSVMSAAYPIVVKKVAPFFAGKDARETGDSTAWAVPRRQQLQMAGAPVLGQRRVRRDCDSRPAWQDRQKTAG